MGYFRLNHLVPIPQANNLEELNEQLRSYCQQDERRRIAGKPMLVGEAMGIEREHLLPLAAEGFELAESIVDKNKPPHTPPPVQCEITAYPI